MMKTIRLMLGWIKEDWTRKPDSPYAEGYHANSLNQNPYPVGSPEHLEWTQGWEGGEMSREAW